VSNSLDFKCDRGGLEILLHSSGSASVFIFVPQYVICCWVVLNGTHSIRFNTAFILCSLLFYSSSTDRIILKLTLKKEDGRMWTGLILLKREDTGELY
jgi:hypothetical protein